MRTVPQATPIILTAKERQVLEALAGSRSEARMRDRAQIVLLAADGMASRASGRAVGCEPGIVSKWREKPSVHALERLLFGATLAA
jgi:hypothetical protein